MKSPLENLAIIVIAILSLLIMGAIVWYNMIDNTINYSLPSSSSAQIKKVKESKTKDYLANMENYEEKDVHISKANTKNISAVKVTSKRDDLHLEKVVEKDHSNQKDFINNVSSALDNAVNEK